MTQTVLYKKSEMTFDPYGSDPARSSIARIIGVETSSTIGAGIATFDNTEVEWTVLYDEVVVCLKGLFQLRVGDKILEANPGDVIWIPEYTSVAYSGDGAEVFYALYPVDWTETRYQKDA